MSTRVFHEKHKSSVRLCLDCFVLFRGCEREEAKFMCTLSGLVPVGKSLASSFISYSYSTNSCYSKDSLSQEIASKRPEVSIDQSNCYILHWISTEQVSDIGFIFKTLYLCLLCRMLNIRHIIKHCITKWSK